MPFGKKKKVEEVSSDVVEAGQGNPVPAAPDKKEEKKDEPLYRAESFSSARHGVFEAEVCTYLAALVQRLDALNDRLDANGKLLNELIQVAKE